MTDIAMPPVQSLPSDDAEDDVAFKVLNQDNLPMSIIGESILKPFGQQNLKQKPNGIVYPTRRLQTNLEENKQKEFAKSNGYINTTLEKNQYNLKKNYSASHGNLNHTNSAVKLRAEDLQNHVDTKFTRVLDAKLKKLAKEEQKGGKRMPETPKKPFVTTVKKGEFLEPPPEIASLIGIKVEESSPPPLKKLEEKKLFAKLYSFASQPRVLNKPPFMKSVHKSKCEAAAKAAACVAGSVMGIKSSDEFAKDINSNVTEKYNETPLPYANLMFDRRVARGTNYAPNIAHQRKWNPNFAYAKLLSQDQGDGESAAARAAEARRRAMARRKAKKQQQRKVQLRLGSPPPVHGRKHEPVQTDQFLEEIWATPPVADNTTQTDLFIQRPVSPFFVPEKTGEDAETQIYPGDLFDFDVEVQPILEVLVGKTVEQALIEVLEEEELAALREQQRRFLELRAAETSEAQRIEEREKRINFEKELRLKEHEEGVRLQNEMEERIAAAVLMQGYMADLLPSVLEGLEAEGFLVDNIKKDVNDNFMPWLVREVTHELQEIVSSRDLLSDLVREILENRAEIYRALNAEPKDEVEEEAEEEAEGEPFTITNDLALKEHLKLRDEIGENLL